MTPPSSPGIVYLGLQQRLSLGVGGLHAAAIGLLILLEALDHTALKRFSKAQLHGFFMILKT